MKSASSPDPGGDTREDEARDDRTPDNGALAGVVTCLFSDIEGSTKLEIELGTHAYTDIRERHRELLRKAFTAHHGHQRGTEGDSFFVVFATASEAVAAAADAQRALAAETWPEGRSIRVRMGIHTGEIRAVGDDVVGLTINRCARISGVAHGGQVLISEITRGLLGDRLPDGITLRDLGDHRLKDLRDPEHLSQLVIAGLASDFPPLRSLDARPGNLPTQLTTFVGREREVADALTLLERTRLLTFTGPGGTGKTRLSLQVAAAAAERFPGGTWFVALEAIRDPSLVAPTIARTIGLMDDAVRPALERVVEEIGDRAVLLVLDNFEQVSEAGPVVADLLRRCPALSCLVTTRIVLHVSGEQEFPVPGLPAPPDVSHLSEVERLNLPRGLREHDVETLEGYEAVRLFVARAVAVRPDFRLTIDNSAAIAGITARLHGMPLALELAAARSRLLTPSQILSRLDQHLAVLTAGARDLPERQQTLRAAIAWSYDLLAPGARSLLDRLSVFRGGFDLESVERVCGPASEAVGDLLSSLEDLVDQSLVRADDIPAADAIDPRFTILETIREYAAEMLASDGETERLRQRHAEAMLALAEEAAGHLSLADQRTWLDRLERDHDNMRAALDRSAERDPSLAARLAFALWRFWQQRGYISEARARLEAMAEGLDDLPPIERARFAEALGGLAYWQSDRPAATRWYDEQLALWREIGDRREIANALYNRAYADMIVVMAGQATRDSLDESYRLFDEALAIFRDLGDRAGEGNIVWGLGSFHYFTADAATAETWFRQSLELHRTAGDRTMEAWSLHMLAMSQVGQRRWREAKVNARHALRHFHEAGDVAGLTLVLDDLALIAVGEDERVRVGRLWGAARHLQGTTGVTLADYVNHTNLLFGVLLPGAYLSAAELEGLGAEGAAMGLDEIVGYALEDEVEAR